MLERESVQPFPGIGRNGVGASRGEESPLTPSDLPTLEDRVRFTAREPSGVTWRGGVPGWSRHCLQGPY